MKRTAFHALLTACLLWILAPSSSGEEAVVYDNTANSLEEFYSTELEHGDEIFLEGSERLVTSFSFELFADSVVAGSTGVLRFYKNDGPEVDGTPAPGEMIFESGSFTLEEGINTLTLEGLSVSVPDQFTWTVDINQPGESEAGLTLYDPPVIGGSFDDFWARTEDGEWDIFRFPGGEPPGNFAAQVTAIAEVTDIQLTHGSSELTLGSVPRGARFAIEASTDLQTWETIAVQTAEGGSLAVSDPEADQFERRFYRINQDPDSPTPPRIVGIDLTDEGATLSLRGLAGERYAVETSSDLENWQEVTTLVAPSNEFEVEHSPNSQAAALFYRVRRVE